MHQFLWGFEGRIFLNGWQRFRWIFSIWPYISKPLRKIMAYWKDLNSLDIDNSYTEYVISEMKYVDSDILSLEFDYITKRRLRFACDHFVIAMAKSLRHGEIAVLVKPVQNKMMAYLQDFYPLDIDDSYTELNWSMTTMIFFCWMWIETAKFRMFMPNRVLCHFWQVRTTRSKYWIIEDISCYSSQICMENNKYLVYIIFITCQTVLKSSNIRLAS